MSLEQAVEQAMLVAPDSPLLALGQTVFWDEPMKASLAIAAKKLGKTFVAGIHDTDYFAKSPTAKTGQFGFKTLPHNDGSTRSLWSAAAEFSSLFGSETVITKELLLKSGLRFESLSRSRKNFLDEATEAWGWRGIVSLNESPPITAEVKGETVIEELCRTLRFTIDESVRSVGGEISTSKGDDLTSMFCDAAEEPGQSLAQIYRRLLSPIYSFVSNQSIELETTQTSELLRFNRETCEKPRFDLLGLFVNHETRSRACSAYNEAIKGYPGLYELSKFGSGAIPFDVVIPGIGRGTLRLGNRGAVISTPKPQFLSFKKPLETVCELAALLEDKFGKNVVIVGKAVTLIGMLAREFVFAFHEGASGYVKVSRALHQKLGHSVNPILRIRYSTWDGLCGVQSWLKLPTPFQAPFGTEELCASSFAGRWREVAQEQKQLLAKLGQLRKPSELLDFLDMHIGGAWKTQAAAYRSLQEDMSRMMVEVNDLQNQRIAIYKRLRKIRVEYQELQKAKGEHFRQFVFEKLVSEQVSTERARFNQKLWLLEVERDKLRKELGELGQQQRTATQAPEIMRIHARRREIELEAELKRLKMIRQAVISSRGLESANLRPSAWWFPLVSPDGSWFNNVMQTAECYWEPLV